jgi:hypothetical protein
MLPDGWHRSAVVAPFRDELKRLVVSAFAGRPLWAWKDPRTCILLDLWKEILAELGIGLDAVAVVRHPRDVAASLGRRDGFGLEKSCGIWLSQTLAALRAVEDVRTVFIGYDAFLEDPLGQVGRCAEALGLYRPAESAAVAAAIRRSVRKDLRHNFAAATDGEPVPAPVHELYELLRPAGESGAVPDGAWFARLREIHREYTAYAGFFREDLERWPEAERRAAAAEAKAAAAEKSALIAVEEARVLDRQGREAARALEEIVSSRIWRVTGPARSVADIVQRKVRTRLPPQR